MASPSFPRVRACLFDMDGLLLDTEDKYTLVTNTILQEYGKPLLPWNIKAQLQGRPQPEASRIFHDWAKLPITPEEYLKKQATLQAKLFPESAPLPGVETLLARLASTKNSDNPVHLALATSSHSKNYQMKTEHLQELFDVFPASQKVLGDDTRIGKGRGKPLPDIYLLALETINTGLRVKGEEEVKPEECLVFEDAVPGVEAGRRAGMRVIWCPHPGLLEAYKGREEEVLAGLTGEHKEEEKTETEKEADVLKKGRLGDSGQVGTIGDGWAELVRSLVDFDYGKYGIQPVE
ncbi:haloacid dehalogenase superfamily protein [Aspergillus chevalieri]|uniref:HAD superfamily hydrolase n=1 Tax=Aspergillus chevalieri TaxID=182096 RepID=A0A7R7VUE0_ASPCH|nr:uncharacterized protein ACHE_60165S [Aspergillus chevalieri]BCR90279.1 hypothetical protein ACHE_60165S [Aspergillus chevalieri]